MGMTHLKFFFFNVGFLSVLYHMASPGFNYMIITGFHSYRPMLSSKILFEIKSYVTSIFRTCSKFVLFFKTDSVT